MFVTHWKLHGSPLSSMDRNIANAQNLFKDFDEFDNSKVVARQGTVWLPLRPNWKILIFDGVANRGVEVVEE